MSEDLRRDFPYSESERARLFERYVTSMPARSVTVNELLQILADRSLPAVRHVQIDVEGWDDVVLSQLPLGRESPLGRFRPASITFEHMLLPRPRLLDALAGLRRHGYSACQEGQNVVAFAVPDGDGETGL